MKKTIQNQLVALALLAFSTLNLQLSTASAQTTAFTYQGRLNVSGASANGTYDFRFRLASDPLANNYVGSAYLTNNIVVANGLFLTTMDFGAGVFTGSNYWLEVDVRTNGAGSYTVLTPLQAVTPTPYAIMANSASNLLGTLPAAQLSGTVAIGSLPASPSFPGTVTAAAFNGSGANLTSLNANNLSSGTLPLAQLPSAVVTNNNAGSLTLTGSFIGNGGGLTNLNAASLNGQVAANFWQLGGNNVTGGQFLGSTNNQAVTIKAYGLQALQLQPANNDYYTYSNIVNLVGGSPVNYIAPGVYGSVIAGGGATRYPNAGIACSNSVFADMSSVGGGLRNSIQANSTGSVLSGGQGNNIGQYATYAFLGGGYGNSILDSATYSFLGGGYGNSIQLGGDRCVLGGGGGNSIQGAFSVLSGGGANSIQAGYSFLGGGNNSSILGGNSVIGGGAYNLIQSNEQYSVIGGGYQNSIQAGPYVADFGYSFIGGGRNNSIQSGVSYGAIAGGSGNSIQTNDYACFIGGGGNNTISPYSQYCTVVGGYGCIVNGLYSLAAGTYAQATNTGSFVWGDDSGAITASVANNSVTMRGSGGFRFFTGNGTAGAQLAAGATAWSVLSDRNQKKDFAAVDVVNILEKLAAIPVTQWHYKWEDQSITPHIGPMAQDFKHAFYPGSDDKSITTLEADGVAFAAIQGLNQKLEETRAENAALKARLEKLEQWIESKHGEAK